MSDVPTYFFLKELLSNPIWLPNGKQAPWEPVGDDTGVIATNDANIIFHLSNLAAQHVGGVVKIDEAGYLNGKKNSNGSELPRPLERASVGGILAAPSLLPKAPPEAVDAGVVVAGGAKPSPTPPSMEAVIPAEPKPVRVGRAKPKAVVTA